MSTKMFTGVSIRRPKYSKFDLSYSNKFSCKFGQLWPVLLQETLPGDIFNIGAQVVVRTTPLVAPIMDKIDMTIRYFFVPNRLVYDDWDDFITGGNDGEKPDTASGPCLQAVNFGPDVSQELWNSQKGKNDIFFAPKTLADAFGLPVHTVGASSDGTNINATGVPGAPDDFTFRITAIPFASYRKIFVDYYIDENLDSFEWQDRHANVSVFQGMLNGSTADIIELSKILSVKYTKNDYFTSALPFPVRGTMPFLSASGSVDILASDTDVGRLGPLTGHTPITFGAQKTPLDQGGPATQYTFVSDVWSSDGSGYSQNVRLPAATWNAISEGDMFGFESGSSGNPFRELVLDADKQTVERGILQYREGSLVGEFNNLGITADDLRYLFATQEYMERNMRGGSRYTEYLINHFGVFAGDARLQRAEYLGSIKSSVFVGDIPQTSESGDTPQGTLKGKGVGAFSGRIKKFRCREHGYIFGLMTFTPKLSYIPQGIRKKWRKARPIDYYIPEFSHLGEQPVYKGELYSNSFPVGPQGDATEFLKNYEVFGYQGKDAEYRHNEDICAGDMRNDYAMWHLGRKFANQPSLNSDFLTIDNEPDGNMRIFADTTDDPFLVNCYNQVSAVRMIPVYPTPSTLLF